jgi:hypothetical protein
MTLWLVERYLAGSVEDALAELRAQTERAVGALADQGVTIAYLGSTAIEADETCFCLFESDSLSAVEMLNASVSAPSVRITEALRAS